MLKTFKEYLETGIARKRTPDILRAEDLTRDSKNRKNFLERIKKNLEIKDEEANYIIEQVYDILIGLIRAKMFLDGFEASGNNAHEAEVSYLRELKFLDEEVSSMNELRMFRNGIKYYGKRYTKEHAEKSIDFMNNLLTKLNRILKVS